MDWEARDQSAAKEADWGDLVWQFGEGGGREQGDATPFQPQKLLGGGRGDVGPALYTQPTYLTGLLWGEPGGWSTVFCLKLLDQRWNKNLTN